MASAIAATPLLAAGARRDAAASRPRPAPRRALAPQRAAMQRPSRVAATPADDVAYPDEEGLRPEDDVEVPGGWQDAMSGAAPLGRAVRGACDELDALGALEREVLGEAEALLKKLGMRGTLFAGEPEGGAVAAGSDSEDGE